MFKSAISKRIRIVTKTAPSGHAFHRCFFFHRRRGKYLRGRFHPGGPQRFFLSPSSACASCFLTGSTLVLFSFLSTNRLHPLSGRCDRPAQPSSLLGELICLPGNVTSWLKCIITSKQRAHRRKDTLKRETPAHVPVFSPRLVSLFACALI